MTELVKYEAARRALAEAVAVDEVLDVRSKADAMRHYARQAGDRGLEIQCAQLRFRAERRLGEMLVEQKETVGLNRGRAGAGRPPLGDSETEQPKTDDRPTLAEVGIDRKLSSKAQRMAAMDAAEFEQALARHKEEMNAGQGRVAMDLLKVGAEEKGRAHRRDLAAALSGKSIMLPTGRLYPALYLDPPWKRQGGIGDRAYENHYPTMSWPDILEALRQAAKSLLPDAWAFMWIPRAHLLALVEVQRELQVKVTGELVTFPDRIPLAWACCLALGADYSTAFVWTKTDADHPDVSGSGLIARDQDELLLLFKRGAGLPKPAGSEKFGSNHRERPREHSRKPDFYRHMIAAMVGCDSAGVPLPVLEMFARVDAEHPLPPGWDACGNQAAVDLEAGELLPDPAPAVAEPVLAGEAIAVPDPMAAFPPSEFVDLKSFECRDDARIPAAQLAAAAPEYVKRGLVHSWCGSWRLSPAGLIRLQVLMRERAARDALFAKHLAADQLTEWRALAAIAGREAVDRETARDLIGKGYVDDFAADRGLLCLTAAGAKWLGSIEAHVEKTDGIERPDPLPPPAPMQLGLLEIIEGAQ